MEESKFDKNKDEFKAKGTQNQFIQPEPNSDENLKNLQDYIERHSEPERVIYGFNFNRTTHLNPQSF